MSLEKAGTGKIIKRHLNDVRLMLAKFFYRENPEGIDPEYGDIVIRQGWTYSGSATDTIIYNVDFGITYDEEPLVFMSVGMTRESDIPEITFLSELTGGANYYMWYNQVITKSGVTVTLKRVGNFDRLTYHGLIWIAIGKKT